MATRRNLRRGTEDYKTILNRFVNKQYNVYHYDAENIRRSNPTWESLYDPGQFAESLKNLISNIHLVPPQRPPQNRTAEAPPAQRAAAPGVSNPRPFDPTHSDTVQGASNMAAPRNPATYPSGLSELEDHTLITPKIVVPWTDSTDNQNDRLTLYIHDMPGHKEIHFKISVVEGGANVSLRYKWPKEFLNADLLNRGHDMYEPGHNKLAAFKEAVKVLRGNDAEAEVESVFWIPLPLQVEEQLAKSEVPAEVYRTQLKDGPRLLAIELMAKRSSYQRASVSREFDGNEEEVARQRQKQEEARRAAAERKAKEDARIRSENESLKREYGNAYNEGRSMERANLREERDSVEEAKRANRLRKEREEEAFKLAQHRLAEEAKKYQLQVEQQAAAKLCCCCIAAIPSPNVLFWHFVISFSSFEEIAEIAAIAEI